MDIPEDAIEIAAEEIHIDWMGESQRQGRADHVWPEDWTIGVRHQETCPIPAAQHHRDMKPYADLSEPTKEYDRVTARAALRGFLKAGYRLVKAAD